MRTTGKLASIVLAAQALVSGSLHAVAGEEDRGRAPRPGVIDVLAHSPAYQAALRSIEAEQSVHRQFRVGPQEWRATVSAAGRTQSSATPGRTNEWELGLERGLRLPGKAEVFDRAGRARVEQADAARRKVWREQARALLDRYAAWLREREAARVGSIQVDLLRQQLDAVAARQRLGDAARIEQRQAEAALAQAQAQFQAASGRSLAAREALERQFPGLDPAQDPALPALPASPIADLPALPIADADWIESQITHSPEVELARREADAAAAQMRLEAAEIRPDPTLGLRLGRARTGAEQFVGVVLSIPFGGEYRRAGAQAAAFRAAAAEQQQLDVQRRAEAGAVQRLREAQVAYSSWLGSADAARRLSDVADSLARGYRLGEGRLGDVLTARRLANEQLLAAAVGAVDALMLRNRLDLEADSLWAEPGQTMERRRPVPPGITP